MRLGTNVAPAYFDQMREQLDPERTVAETVSPGSEWIDVNGVRKHVLAYMGDFLFSPQRVNSPVRMLSGGERNRLLLARLFARPTNVLVLDEPTNDLDLESLEMLEAALQDYPGTLLLVSHDRAFLDNIVTQTLVAEGGGVWREYVGGYSDWLSQTSSCRRARRGFDERACARSSRRAHAASARRAGRGGSRSEPGWWVAPRLRRAGAPSVHAPSSPTRRRASWKRCRQQSKPSKRSSARSPRR